MLKCGIPPIVVRIIIYCYEEQVAWVKWGNVKSEKFGISNGTRQGAVLSPPLFSLYLDDLLKELRALGVGCHMGGLWMGSTLYADDLLLLAPTRSAMEAMMKVCERYALDNNISFRTNENPAISKTECLYICGDMNRNDYPAAIKLNGKDLPFVKTATHLGHELSQDGSMSTDIKRKQAKFIDKSIEIRETFFFADPVQILSAVNTYCCDHYGSMLWDLYSEPAGQYYRCWNTCTKLAWNCPRSTHTYFVTCQLAADFVSIRTKILASYVKFFKSLLNSKSPEVALVANLMGHDVGSTTGSNLYRLRQETGLNPWMASPTLVKMALEKNDVMVPDEDGWRLPLLEKLLLQRCEMRSQLQNTSAIQGMIDSLCSS